MANTNIAKQENVTITMESVKKLDGKLRELNEQMMKKGLSMCPLLQNMASTKGYALLGYDNIYDYSAAALGRSRGMTSQYISIAERFFKRNVNNPELCTGSIIEQYKDYKVTQLNEIRYLTDEEIANFKITPSSKISEIKEVVAAVKNQKSLDDKVSKAIKDHNKEMAKNDNAQPKDFINPEKDIEAVEEIEKEILHEEAKKADLMNLRKEVRGLLVAEIDKLIKELDDTALYEIKDNPVKLALDLNDAVFEYELLNCESEEDEESEEKED